MKTFTPAWFMCSFITLMCIGSAAVADDYNPPWWRNAPNSVMAQWNSWQGVPVSPADNWSPQGIGWGRPEMLVTEGTVNVVGDPPTLEIEEGDEIVFWLQNWPTFNETKYIRLQMTIFAPYESYMFKLIGLDWNDDGWDDPYDPVDVFIAEDRTLDGNWLKLTYDAVIHPNPTEEWLKPQFDFSRVTTYYVKQFVIDTLCIPEPGTISLLALYGLTMLRCRRH